MNTVLGLDIGGTGIKGAIVDVDTGNLLTARYRLETPHPATPGAVSQVVQEVIDFFNWKGPVGCGFPAAIQNGFVRTAANISTEWLHSNAEELFSSKTGLACKVMNDADAAGMAEMRFGAGREQNGVVMMVTVGTGIGTSLFSAGVLFPNTELGHLERKGMKVEHYASNAIRKREALNWEDWGRRLNDVLHHYYALFWPDVFILGGGVSKKHEEFFPFLDIPIPIFPAEQKNEAGIIGAAVHSYECLA